MELLSHTGTLVETLSLSDCLWYEREKWMVGQPDLFSYLISMWLENNESSLCGSESFKQPCKENPHSESCL